MPAASRTRLRRWILPSPVSHADSTAHSVPRIAMRYMAVVAIVLSNAIATKAVAGYDGSLLSPVPPAGESTFTWRTSGTKPKPGAEIGFIRLRGCWTAPQIVAVSVVDRFGSPVAYKLHSGGPRDNSIQTADLSDKQLPVTVRATFSARFGSTTSGTSLFVKTGGGPNAGTTFDVGGPTCAPPIVGESIEQASQGVLALSSPLTTSFARHRALSASS